MSKYDKHKVITYILVNDDLKREFGKISFNGKFTFELNKEIDPKIWNKIGIIPLPEGEGKIEVDDDLFYYLNSRLPQSLRKSKTEDKLKYIDETGLRVASDSFRLQPAS